MTSPRAVPPSAWVPGEPETANDRLKASLGNRLWSSMIAATALHFALFALWPTMDAADLSASVDELTHVELPEKVDIPESPEPIPQPMHPLVGGPDIPEDVTIGDTRIDAHPPSDRPPPPPARSTDPTTGPVFTPYTVAPRLLNESEIARALETDYPAALRDSGIGGTVTVHLHVGEDGAVREARVHAGSGFSALDRAALAVAGKMRFEPALNRDRKVAVWVQQAITFTAR